MALSTSSSPDWKGMWNISHSDGTEATASTTPADMYRGWLSQKGTRLVYLTRLA